MAKKFYKKGGSKRNAEKLKGYVKKYSLTAKGRATRKAWLENNREKRLAYHSAYNKKRREEAREKNLCRVCLKKRPRTGLSICKPCSLAINARRKERSLKNGGRVEDSPVERSSGSVPEVGA